MFGANQVNYMPIQCGARRAGWVSQLLMQNEVQIMGKQYTPDGQCILFVMEEQYEQALVAAGPALGYRRIGRRSMPIQRRLPRFDSPLDAIDWVLEKVTSTGVLLGLAAIVLIYVSGGSLYDYLPVSRQQPVVADQSPAPVGQTASFVSQPVEHPGENPAPAIVTNDDAVKAIQALGNPTPDAQTYIKEFIAENSPIQPTAVSAVQPVGTNEDVVKAIQSLGNPTPDAQAYINQFLAENKK